MQVEFVGPPGAGKTTIVKGLREADCSGRLPLVSYDEYQSMNREFGEKSIMKLNRLARWTTLLRYGIRRARFSLAIAALCLMHGRPMIRRSRKAQKVLAHTLFAERLETRCPGRVVVHHDGFTQCLWSMLIDSGSLRGARLIRFVMQHYYERFRPLLVVLRADDELVTSRVFSRVSKGRFNRDSSALRRAEFGRWLDYHRQLLGFLPSALELLPFEADAPSEDLARRIVGELEKAWEHEADTLIEARAGGPWTQHV